MSEELELELDDDTIEEGKVEKQVPLKALEIERHKKDAVINKLKEQLAEKAVAKENDAFEKEMQALKEELITDYLDDGLSEERAQRKASREVSDKKELHMLKEQMKRGEGNSRRTKYDLQFDKLVGTYDVDEESRDELVNESIRTGYTIEQTYKILHGDKVTTESERIAEQRRINERNKQLADVDFNEGSLQRKPRSKVDASQDDIDMAKESGMSLSRFLALKNPTMDLEQYEKLTKRKE